MRKDALELRGYQEKIISAAIEANTLVVLPTGLGKTVIAAMVAAHRLQTCPESRVLFLAPTKPLAVQHMKSFMKFLTIENMCVLTGAEPVKKRRGKWEESKVIFATPQTIENDMLRGLDISDVSLVIFDEAHRTTGDYSYVSIAKDYMRHAKNQLILALTASPSSEKEKVKEICTKMGIKNVEAKTDRDEDVRQYTQDVKVTWVKYDLPGEFSEIHANLKEMYKKQLVSLKEYGFLDSADPRKMSKTKLLMLQTQVRAHLTSGGVAFAAASRIASAIKINHAIELLETQGIKALDEYLTRLKAQNTKSVKMLYNDPNMTAAVEQTKKLRYAGFEHPKINGLKDILSKHRGEKILIFTQYRDSVDSIIEKLNNEGFLAHEFIGQARKGANSGMTQKKQIEILEKFRDGKYDALVATSVAEEGLDIPKVEVVIFYEPIPSEIRTIQRRGRTGRQAAGRVYVLMAKGTRDEAYYWSSYYKEKKMRDIVDKMGDDVIAEETQQSLTTYAVETEHVKVLVDNRERNTKILSTLKENCDVELAHLPVGDYLASDRVCIERKTTEDFLQSLIDKRLMEQMTEMKRNFEIPILIIEGNNDIYSLRNIHANAIRGAISSIALDFGVRIIPARDEEDTANYIISLAKREQLENARPIALRGDKKPELMHEKQRFVIESLPNVSAVLAQRLLTKFGSVENVVCATEDELTQVEGIGKKKATQIRQVIEAKYKL
ncbi:MAG: DEAD/DEAH box helicase [Candidatus Altiarchaeota archaeon]|nr:DEAD/DEAH box helicase [Candidatus Altiarchaeota archaeon]